MSVTLHGDSNIPTSTKSALGKHKQTPNKPIIRSGICTANTYQIVQLKKEANDYGFMEYLSMHNSGKLVTYY